MTNLVDRPNSDRGQRRRDQLVDAGLALLSEGGWPAVTSRAVAERSGANMGLIHYHFGGLPGLHVAIAEQAGEALITPIVEALLAATDVDAALTAVSRLIPTNTSDETTLRLAIELVAGAFRDPALGTVVRSGLRHARAQLADRLADLYPEWTAQRRAGAATLAAALLDGLMLHVVLDSELPTETALIALGDLIGARR